ncbi:hypothetical protein EJ06DRAFT_531085 [Trichodelitschia bisporula]|uniref:Membrane anchor Opy2 N-terminal domain-containing protein n=1 Tax=Trichodelitschia bisporula TaxID=703511 RepID=A0A6G1HUF4_9PEZI|nr:hypothetical protein EJ06DRAFT_531085 [Trichodelitschia bisporula]
MATNLLSFGLTSAFPLVKRCVQCPNVAPSCPTCKGDEVCTQTVASCDTCPVAQCIKTALSGTTASTSGTSDGPNIGAIVGGVMGGVVAVAIIVFLIWKFFLHSHRHDVVDDGEWQDAEYPPEKTARSANASVLRDARSSTHTVTSMASTVLTRASNIIQIAYIPGVTNRSGTGGSPALLVPPVPPIPIPTGSHTGSPYTDDQRFFVPADLRGSTYSDMSGMSGDAMSRKSVASSLVRNSMASTVYRDSAVVNPMPAQTIVRGKAAMVLLKSGTPSSAGTSAHATPSIGSTDFAPAASSPLAAPAVSASASTTSARPVLIKVPSSSDTPSNPNTLKPSAVGSVRMKPVALNIVKKSSKPTVAASIASSISAASTTAASAVPAVSVSPPSSAGTGSTAVESAPLLPVTYSPRVNAPPSPPRRRASALTAESVGSAAPGARARASVLRTPRIGGEESDEEEVGDAHERSRRSLLGAVARAARGGEVLRGSVGEGPFSDDKAAPASPGLTHSGERGRSPFEDEHAV